MILFIKHQNKVRKHKMKDKSEPVRGWYDKYIVTKADGSPVDPKATYMVLKLDTDKAAQAAALEYARKTENLLLREDILNIMMRIIHCKAEEIRNKK